MGGCSAHNKIISAQGSIPKTQPRHLSSCRDDNESSQSSYRTVSSIKHNIIITSMKTISWTTIQSYMYYQFIMLK